MKLGNENINKLYIGNDAVNKMYIGDTLKYDNSLWTLNDTTVFVWYDMMQGVINAGSGKVSAWNDALGNTERNISQGTPANRPTITANAVEFNGTSEFLWNSAPFMYGKTEGVHIIAIMSGDEGTSTAERGISEASSDNNIQNYSLLCKDNFPSADYNKTTQAMRDDSNFNCITYGGNAGTNTAWDNSFRMVEHIDTRSQIKTAINCQDGGTPITYERPEVRLTTPSTMTLNRFGLGALVRLTTASHMKMKIKSLVILPANTLTTDTRQRVQGYLAHRYNLQSTSILPTKHPYKTVPPTR